MAEVQETDDPRLGRSAHGADRLVCCRATGTRRGRAATLKRKDWCATHLTVALPEHGVGSAERIAIVGNGDAPLMLVHAYAQDVDLDATRNWTAGPARPRNAWSGSVAPRAAVSAW